MHSSSSSKRQERNYSDQSRNKYKSHDNKISGNWRKKEDKLSKQSKSPENPPRHKLGSCKSRSQSPIQQKHQIDTSASSSDDEKASVQPNSSSRLPITDFLTDQQMNELGAKIISAEINGNDTLVNQLQDKLNRARKYREAHKHELLNAPQKESNPESEDILLTSTNSQGFSKPLQRSTAKPSDPWGGRSKKKCNKKVETHAAGERVRYFADDDKYDIKQMVCIFKTKHC